MFFVLSGFATVPAYLAGLFGTQMVGAIHGRLLTAWAAAVILGPVLVNYMREYQLGLGLPHAQVYHQTMYVLVGMLAIGLLCNLLVRPVADKWFMTDGELLNERRLAHDKATASNQELSSPVSASSSPTSFVILAWAAVGIPLAWGVYRTLLSAAKFFDQKTRQAPSFRAGGDSVDTEGVLPLYTGRVERPTAGRAGSNACGDTSSAVRRSAQEPTEATMREVTHA